MAGEDYVLTFKLALMRKGIRIAMPVTCVACQLSWVVNKANEYLDFGVISKPCGKQRPLRSLLAVYGISHNPKPSTVIARRSHG